MSSPDTFASDAEREAVADRLRLAAGEGRLTPDELAERLGVAYTARTHAELEAVVAGLPTAPAKPSSKPVNVSRRLQRELIYYVPIVAICILIWAFSGADSNFWPKWVILGVLIRLLVTGRAAGLRATRRPQLRNHRDQPDERESGLRRGAQGEKPLD
ncbi:MAG TPA: DUF1707 domain-containing protein [Gaiellaceae bacterium]